MSLDEERVTSIIWGFDDDNLLLSGYNGNERRRYDISACARNYANICLQRLQQAYPKANIQIVYHINPSNNDELLPNTVQTRVTFEPNYDDRTFDPDYDDVEIYINSYDVERVERVCTEVYKDEVERWQVERGWRSITNLSKQFNIPVSVIRLACQQKLIQDMWIDERVWKVLRKDFAAFYELVKPYLEQEAWAIIIDDTQDYSIRGMTISDLLENQQVSLSSTTYWLIKLDWMKLPSIFQAQNSLVSLQFNQSQFELSLHFFNTSEPLVDIDRTYEALTDALMSQASEYSNIEAIRQEYSYLHNHVESLQLKFQNIVNRKQTLKEQIEQSVEQLSYIIQDAKIALYGGIKWKPIYEKKPEDRFRKEVLDPLLRHMGYIDVRNRHGTDEYGRDFTFSWTTPSGELLHFGLQAKAGNISGKANSDIDTLFSQLTRAFDMSYHEPPYNVEKRYISVFIIAISGEFTREAQKIIQERLPKHQVGSVFFWDKVKITNLINQLWPKDKTK